MKLKQSRRSIYLAVLVLVLASGSYLLNRPSPHTIAYNQVPSGIRGQLDFRALYPPPTPTDGWALVAGSAKTSQQEDGTLIFSFILKGPKADVTFSEQAYPEVLIYDNVVNGVNPYAETGSIYGKISLGKPKNASGSQTAVLKFGTDALIFAKPTQDLSNSDWRKIFNTLQVVK